jgi:hypothetical protein
MKRVKRVKKQRRAKNRAFQIIRTIIFLCILYFGVKYFVYAEEVAVGLGQDAQAESIAQEYVVEEALPIVEEAVKVEAAESEEVVEEDMKKTDQPKGLSDLIPDGVVYDPEGESFVTIDGEVIKEGEYYYEFLLESITPDMVLFSDDEEEYEIPVRSLGRLESVIKSFEDIYVEGLLYDAQGESYVVINDTVARVGDTIGGFLVESIGDSKVLLRQDDLRFEVTIPHFEEESRKLPLPDVASLVEAQGPVVPLNTGAGAVAVVE